jgi:very-short-patch-repair endonuclease
MDNTEERLSKRDSLGHFINGHKRSKQSRDKQSVTLRTHYKTGKRIAWQKGKTNCKCGVKKGNIPWNKGLTSKDSRVKKNILNMAKTRKKLGYISENLRSKIKATTNTPKFKEYARLRRSKQIFPLKDTSIEKEMEKMLRSLCISFKKHVPIKLSDSFHQVDFLLSNKVVIECDGNYWHKLPNVIKRDNQINNELRQQNFKVFRFWEKDILTNKSACLSRLLRIRRDSTPSN